MDRAPKEKFIFQPIIFAGSTLPETDSSHLKMDGWKTIVSFWDGLFSGVMLVLGSYMLVSGRTTFPPPKPHLSIATRD